MSASFQPAGFLCEQNRRSTNFSSCFRTPMNIYATRIFFLMVVFATLFSLPNYAHACSCAIENDRYPIDKFEVVFWGTAIDSSDYDMYSNNNWTKFSVKKAWKGISAPYENTTITILHQVQGTACGVTFKLNQDYIIYTTGSHGSYGVSSCVPIIYLGTSVR